MTMMDYEARRTQLMAKLKELQASAAQLDVAFKQTQIQIERVVGALELLAEVQQQEQQRHELAKQAMSADTIVPVKREREK